MEVTQAASSFGSRTLLRFAGQPHALCRAFSIPGLCSLKMLLFSLSLIQFFVTPWTGVHSSLSFTISQSLLKLMLIESVMPPNHLILCHPLFLLPSILPSIRVFSNELALHIRWPKYWSFSFSISLSNEYSGLISFRIDWVDLLAVQGTLKSLLHTTVQKHQLFGVHLSLLSNSHIHTRPQEKP